MYRDTPFAPPAVSQQIVDLTRLLEWCREGRLRWPGFQRGFVWKRPDMLALFDSIARGYPIGSFIFVRWREGDRGEDRLGPLRLPQPTGEPLLILDGLQRIVTLAGVLLRGEPIWQGEDGDDRWDVCFDAEAERFVHHRLDGRRPVTVLPVHHMIDVVRFWAWADEARHVIGPERMRRLQAISRALQACQVPILIVEGDRSTAVEIFSRINTAGHALNQTELLAAQTHGPGFDLRRELESLSRFMGARGFGAIPDARVRDLALASAGFRLAGLDVREIGADAGAELTRAVDRARTGLDEAFAFLAGLGVFTGALLPHVGQLTLLALFFSRRATPTPTQRALLRRWFWVTAFTGWLAHARPHRFEHAVSEFRDSLPNASAPVALKHLDLDHQASATPARLTLRNPRVRAMLCVVLHRQPRGPDGKATDPRQLAERLSAGRSEAMAPVFDGPLSPDIFQDPANWIFRPRSTPAGAAAEWLAALAEIPLPERQRVLDSHVISAEAFTALRDGRAEDFIAIRRQDLVALERTFMVSEEVSPFDGP